LGRHHFGVENLSEIMKIFEHSFEFDAAAYVWDVPNQVGELVNLLRSCGGRDRVAPATKTLAKLAFASPRFFSMSSILARSLPAAT
jgi:hypothetical protein